jgi:hypothetical protein
MSLSPLSEDQPFQELSSSDKKRLQERRAPWTLRERCDLQVKLMEQEVAECRRLHDPGRIRCLSELVGRLEQENDALRYRQEELQSLLDSRPTPEIHQHQHQHPQPQPPTTYPTEIIASFDTIDPALAATTSSLRCPLRQPFDRPWNAPDCRAFACSDRHGPG